MEGEAHGREVAVKPNDAFDPRDVVPKNVSGSTAGASSGDFHVYRHQRRRELERIENMEKDAEEKKSTEEQMKAAEQRRLKEEAQTQRRAAKRRRKKELRKHRKKSRVSDTNGVSNEHSAVPGTKGALSPERSEEREPPPVEDKLTCTG